MDSKNSAWINAMFLIVTLVINALGGMGAINGLSQGEVSNMFETLITPSPFTFSIWGLIYTLLIISIIVMIFKSDDSYYKNVIDRISVLFRISCVLNMAWIVAFSYVLLELSVLLILSLVVVLSLICKELLSVHESGQWLVPLTFGMYTGWLLIASVVNIAATLVKIEWNGFGIPDEIWAAIILIAAVFITILVNSSLKNAVIPLPVAWAYFGIYQNLKSPTGFNGEYELLQIIALVEMVVFIVIAGIQFYKNHFALLPEK